jgi:hypothetical protein
LVLNPGGSGRRPPTAFDETPRNAATSYFCLSSSMKAKSAIGLDGISDIEHSTPPFV